MIDVDMKKVAHVKAELEKQGVRYCFATYVDVHGIPKAKTVPLASFEKMCKGSELFTVGAMEGMGLVGPHQDECAAVPDLDTVIVCPWDKRFAFFFGTLYYHGEPYANDTRTILRRLTERARARGYQMDLGVEAEFYVLRKAPDGTLQKLQPRPFKGVCPAYDVHQSVQAIDFLDPMCRYMNELGWGVYSFDAEGGHSQFEFDFAFTDCLTTADRVVFLRMMAKVVAQSLGCVATFMPKPFPDDFRSGAHCNISLSSVDTGQNLFIGERGVRGHQGFSELALSFAAGLLDHAPAISAVACPTYNSYQGLLARGDMPDDSWAPVLRCWGNNNRSAMLRLPMSRPCIENRAVDMAMNPYLCAALQLAAGLDGIDRKLHPGEPSNENLYQKAGSDTRVREAELLPRTLLDALRGFEADPLVESALGAEMKAIYLKQKTREWERHFYQVSPAQLEDMLEFV